ncbi:hypothetical protein BZL29_2862 [Mycobacterium kansasii]|uniref:Uncharacterized protein n=1 Tax=Mycobacterium kansasii TaxID=1768 RepID=A0A1V3XL93_MYCKA|nr:hypothetical protein BZL29_2862 [Mycobacterium kansasii]
MSGYRLRVQITLWSRYEDISALSQHRFARPAAAGGLYASRDRRLHHHHRNEITEIIPLDGFDGFDELELADLDELDFGDPEFGTDVQLLQAPELDDLHETDDLTPAWLAGPTEVLAALSIESGGQAPAPRPHAATVTPVPGEAGSTASSRPALPRDAC